MAGWGFDWGNDPWGGQALTGPVDITMITVDYSLFIARVGSWEPIVVEPAAHGLVSSTAIYASRVSKAGSP